MNLFQALILFAVVALSTCRAIALEFTVGEFINISKELDIVGKWCNMSSQLWKRCNHTWISGNETGDKCWKSLKTDFEENLSHVLGVKVNILDHHFSSLYRVLECQSGERFSLKTTSYITHSTVLFTHNGNMTSRSAPTPQSTGAWISEKVLGIVISIMIIIITEVIRVFVSVWVKYMLAKYQILQAITQNQL